MITIQTPYGSVDIDPQRWTDDELPLLRAGLCPWVTSYGMPGMTYCRKPGQPLCPDHDRDEREASGGALAYGNVRRSYHRIVVGEWVIANDTNANTSVRPGTIGIACEPESAYGISVRWFAGRETTAAYAHVGGWRPYTDRSRVDLAPAPRLCLLKGCQMVKDGIRHYPHCPGCGDTHRIVYGIPGRVMAATWIDGAVQHECRTCNRRLRLPPAVD